MLCSRRNAYSVLSSAIQGQINMTHRAIVSAAVVQTKAIPRRFILLVSVGLAIAGLLALEFGVMAGYAQPASSPFSPYADVMPGQPLTAAQGAGFVCESIPYHIDCSQRPTSGPFARISAIITHNDIENVHFTVRANTLTVGDLILLWGRPEYVRFASNPLILYWEQMSASALIFVQDDHPLTYFQALDLVTFGVEYETADTPLFVDQITIR